MQGTLAVLMALSGLGCNHKSCDTVTTACYSAPVVDSCYSSCYSAPIVDSCYSAPAVYDSCYSSSCYSAPVVESCSPCAPRRRHGLFGGLFNCFRKNRSYDCAPVAYSGCYAGPSYESMMMSAPMIYGAAPAIITPSEQYIGSSQSYPASQVTPTTAPETSAPAAAEPASPAPPAPAPAPAAAEPTPPPPAPAPAATEPVPGAAEPTPPPPAPAPAADAPKF
jgi:hypothetical protein